MSSRRKAFSLIEFTLVLALIGLIAGIVVISTRAIMIRAKQNAVRGEISTICTALENFQLAYGRYPGNDEGLAILARKSEKFAEPLLPRVPVDPWDHAYVYTQPGREHPYDVICLGADGRPGGSGADLDINCWDLKEKVTKGGP